MSDSLSAAPPNPLQQQSAHGANPLSSGQPMRSAPLARRVPPTIDQMAGQIIGAKLNDQQRGTLIQHLNYAVNEFGKLASKDGVTRRDVVKATADAIGAGVITAEEGVQFLGQIPDSSDMLRPWLNDLYHHYMVAAVAAHAVNEVHAQAAAQPKVVTANARVPLAVIPGQQTPPVPPTPTPPSEADGSDQGGQMEPQP